METPSRPIRVIIGRHGRVPAGSPGLVEPYDIWSTDSGGLYNLKTTTGTANFYEGIVLPSSFTPKGSGYSGTLMSTKPVQRAAQLDVVLPDRDADAFACRVPVPRSCPACEQLGSSDRPCSTLVQDTSLCDDLSTLTLLRIGG